MSHNILTAVIVTVALCTASCADVASDRVKTFFPFGMWYAARLTDKGISEQTVAQDMQALGLNFALAIADSNLPADSDDPKSLASILTLADNTGLKVLVGLSPLVKNDIAKYSPEEFDSKREELKLQLAPFVAEGKKHPSALAWWLGDEPIAYSPERAKVAEKLRLLYSELDPERPAFCEGPWGVIERDVVPHINLINEPVYMPEVYPFWNQPYRVGIGDFRSTGFKKPAGIESPTDDEWVHVDVVDQYKEVRSIIGERALWPWLAAFREPSDPPAWDWRPPTPEELRCQAWIAIAEGCRGLCWFGYEHARNFGDYNQLFPEIKSVVSSVSPLTDALLDCHVAENIAAITGGGSRYYETGLVETLRDSHGAPYLVVVNRNCEGSVNSIITVRASLPEAAEGSKWLAVDPATNAIIKSGASRSVTLALDMRPGDGRMVRLIASPELKPVIEPDRKTAAVGEEIQFAASGGIYANGPAFYRWSVTGSPAGKIDPLTGVFTSSAPGPYTIWCRDAAGNTGFTRHIVVR